VRQAIDFVVEHSSAMTGAAVKDTEDDEVHDALVVASIAFYVCFVHILLLFASCGTI
jgi:hypothetical protein